MMSGKNEEIDTYAAQIMVIMNTKEATAHFWNLILELKMWEKLESNLPMCCWVMWLMFISGCCPKPQIKTFTIYIIT